MSDMRLIRLSKVARHFVVGIGACAQVFDSQPIGCSQIARLIKFQWGHSWVGVAVWIGSFDCAVHFQLALGKWQCQFIVSLHTCRRRLAVPVVCF